MDGEIKGKGAVGEILLRIWFPLSLFAACMSLLIAKDELYVRFLSSFSGVFQVIFEYGSQIGVWLSGAFLVQRFISVVVWDGMIAGISGRAVPRLPKDFTAILVFGIALMGVLATVFNQSITGIWATSGVLGIVIGIALRNIILDVFIGLSMHVEQPFRIGDWVMIHQNRRETHIIGQVIEINWRTTRLKTTEKNMIVIPNSKMGEAILTNYMRPDPYFRIDLNFVLDYSIPPNRAIRLLLGAVKSIADDKRILNHPEPEVRLDEALGTGQKYEVRFFILPKGVSPKESRHLVNKRIVEHLIRAGVAPAIEKEQVFLSREPKKALINQEDFSLRRILKSNSLFSMLPDSELDNLEGYLLRREIRPGEYLFRQGNDGRSMFILVEGLLQSTASYDDLDGKSYEERIGPGQHFGEECVLGPNSRASTVSALTGCVLFEISSDKVMELSRRNGNFLALLNADTGIARYRSMEERHKLKIAESPPISKSPKVKKKMGTAIQTFFTDMFPPTTSSRNENQ